MRRVTACPMCKSTHVSEHPTDRTGELGLPALYSCNYCKYTGYKFIQVDAQEAEEQEKELRSLIRGRPQTSFQNSSFWKSTAPAGVVCGIVFIVISPLVGFALIGMGAWLYRVTYFPARHHNV